MDCAPSPAAATRPSRSAASRAWRTRKPSCPTGDGKPDIAVAAFGWHAKGEIALLRNRTVGGGEPTFERTKLDPRAGAIHVVPADIDGDGQLDIVALIAQEHEAVVAFLGDGKGGYLAARTLYAAPHPNWGSSGIQVVDLDKDGDLDVLMTNGDMFDDDILKPYHGIQWLENKGRLRFEAASPGRARGRASRGGRRPRRRRRPRHRGLRLHGRGHGPGGGGDCRRWSGSSR